MTEEKKKNEEINKDMNIKEEKDHKDKKHNKNKEIEDVIKLTKEEVEAINKKASDAEERALRHQAELINYRKRKDEEVSKMLEYANEDIIKDILPTIDNFERAINLDDTNLDDELSKFLAGFKMIYCHLTSILEKYEVKEIIGLNEPFNPNIQQAVLVEKVKDVNPGIVVEVMQKGYMLKGKVIRPAMVKVSE